MYACSHWVMTHCWMMYIIQPLLLDWPSPPKRQMIPISIYMLIHLWPCSSLPSTPSCWCCCMVTGLAVRSGSISQMVDKKNLWEYFMCDFQCCNQVIRLHMLKFYACTNLWPDWFVNSDVKTTCILFNWIMSLYIILYNTFMKWSPGLWWTGTI